MENIFNNRHDVDEVDKVNMDDLYEKKQQSDLLKLKTYKMVLNRIHTRIKVTSRQNNNEQFCWFVIPEVILGAPKYDAPSCIVYVVNELKENGFKVKYTHPNLLFISWKHYIPGYVRSEFKKQTGCSALINTSFNVRGEPIVCTPHDAYRCFMNTEMDVLVCGSYIFLKEDQPYWEKEELSLND